MAAADSSSVPVFNWRLGGPQGSGLERMAQLFTRAIASQGLQVFCRREYHSNIIGRHSYIDVAMADTPVHCQAESIDLLLSFEAETLCRHSAALKPGGLLIHAQNDTEVALDSLGFLDARLREDLSLALQAENLPLSTAGILAQARSRDIHCLAVPYTDLLAELAGQLGVATRRVTAAINTLAVGVSAAVLGLPQAFLREAVAQVFAGRDALIDLNRRAVQLAYASAARRFTLPPPVLPRARNTTEARLLLTGVQSAALGKLAAGLGFQTYYPISPASDESVWLEAHCQLTTRSGEAVGPLILQVEDEIAAINMASGAALTGARAATATSGPGLSLMTEGLGWAGMNEVPVVITHYQRGGPSTGMPTRTEQADLLGVLHAGHGEFPRLLLASGDVESCFYDAAQAFDYAEQYQLPVIHLLDKALASSLQTLPAFDTQQLRIKRGDLGVTEQTPPPSADGFARFACTASGISARPRLGEVGGQHWLTGVEHTETGEVSEDPVLRERMMEKRARKLATAAAAIPPEEKLRVFGDREAPFTLLTWGSTTGAVRDAVARLAADGIAARAIQVRLLWPFPLQELGPLLTTASPLVVVEANESGQFNSLLRAQLGRAADTLIVKYSGRPFSGEALYPHLVEIHGGRAAPRIVIRNPFE